MRRAANVTFLFFICLFTLHARQPASLTYLDKPFDEIIYVERAQYVSDHHNTATMFQKGEVNEASFTGPSALKVFNLGTSETLTLLACEEGIIRDPELSFDGETVIFSMRRNRDDGYHIYEVGSDGSNLKQLTFADQVTDIDPLYLPDGSIIFSSTREPKYCMCNRHIMANLYLMDGDGANIIQIGNSTLHEAHAALLNDGRIIYDRWEYVDRNFGDAQGLWAVYPDGTKHSVYYGNNTPAPGGVIDGRAIPGSEMITCIFGSCHDRPWGALVMLDRRRGVDGVDPVYRIWPADAINRVTPAGDTRFDAWDAFVSLPVKYEDPFPLSEDQILVSRYIQRPDGRYESKMGLYLVDAKNNTETLLLEDTLSVFDPQPLCERYKPTALPLQRNFNRQNGTFYVQNVYEGTHMEGVKPGSVKYLRVIESPPKLNWTRQAWLGQGQQAPGMNWTNFENKRVLGEAPVEEDGSAHLEVPSNTFVFFQLLDKDRKMIQSMRSGTMVQSGEVNGCIGCHENRISVPPPTRKMPIALARKADRMNGWNGKAPELFSYLETVQPIFDRHCVQCHDFDPKNRSKLVLAPDQSNCFNASYVDLFVKKAVKVAGAGRAAIMQAYSWGAHASRLTQVIDGDHHEVQLSGLEKKILYTWMDINAVYYPVYETAYPDNIAGRSPLNDDELRRLGALTGLNFWKINDHRRNIGPQIAFERPEQSPCLDPIREDAMRYKEALSIIQEGGTRLKLTPNGAKVAHFSACEKDATQLQYYALRKQEEERFMIARAEGRKEYDKR